MGKRIERPSKSAAKRDAQAKRALADRLVELKPGQAEKLIDDRDLLAAISDARAMPSHGAGRRQRQFIAKLLRQIDTGDIEAGLAIADAGPAAERRLFHRAEALRDQLLTDTDIDAVLVDAGLSPDDALRSEIRAWRAARDERQRKRAGRELFRHLLDALRAVEPPKSR